MPYCANEAGIVNRLHVTV